MMLQLLLDLSQMDISSWELIITDISLPPLMEEGHLIHPEVFRDILDLSLLDQ